MARTLSLRPTRHGIGTTTIAIRLAYAAAMRGNEVEWYTARRDWDMISAYIGRRMTYQRGGGYQFDPITNIAYDGFSGDVRIFPLEWARTASDYDGPETGHTIRIIEHEPIGFTDYITPDLETGWPSDMFDLVIQSDLEVCHDRAFRNYDPDAILVLRTGLGRMPASDTFGGHEWPIRVYAVPCDRTITEAMLSGRLMTAASLINHDHTDLMFEILDLVDERSVLPEFRDGR